MHKGRLLNFLDLSEEEILNETSIIIALEGIDGVGKSTLWRRLKDSLPQDLFGFVHFSNFSNEFDKAKYVVDQIRSGSFEKKIIISDRWLISNIIYAPNDLYYKDLSYEYRGMIFPDYIYYIEPYDVKKTYKNMVLRDTTRNEQLNYSDLAITSFKEYKKLLDRYDDIIKHNLNCCVLDNRNCDRNFCFILDEMLNLYKYISFIRLAGNKTTNNGMSGVFYG